MILPHRIEELKYGFNETAQQKMDDLWKNINKDKPHDISLEKWVSIIATVHFDIHFNNSSSFKNGDKYEQLAYHDQMTGCLNRLAWAEIIRGVDVEKNSGVVIMFDLNDLKVINDTKGHEYGDKYIIESASIMQEILGNNGSIFRVGGDEFCILMHANKLKEAEIFLARLDEAFAKYNKAHPDMPISIAYGSARFDKLTDMDLNDTRSRADSEMYHNKFKMKEKRQ